MTEDLSLMSLTIGKSVIDFQPRELKKFYRWRSTSNPTELTGTESFYSLHTNVRISRFLECLKLEIVFDELPVAEQQALYDFPGVLKDILFTNLLRAKAELQSSSPFDWQLEFPRLLERLQLLQLALGRSTWNENLLYTYLGNLKYELILSTRRIRPFRKYSGYVKTPSAAGTKRGSFGMKAEPEIFDRTTFEERDLVPFLLSPSEDYSLLGFSAESPIYHPLIRILQERKEIPNEFKKFLLFRPI